MPSSDARSTTSPAQSPATVRSTVAHVSSRSAGIADSCSHAGVSSISDGRARLNAIHPSAAGNSRVAPPQLTLPFRCRPAIDARSPIMARQSRSTRRPNRSDHRKIVPLRSVRISTTALGTPSGGRHARPQSPAEPDRAQASDNAPDRLDRPASRASSGPPELAGEDGAEVSMALRCIVRSPCESAHREAPLSVPHQGPRRRSSSVSSSVSVPFRIVSSWTCCPRRSSTTRSPMVSTP